jgi:putative ABC transport system permease protein
MLSFETTWHDIRHALRTWRSQPSLYAIALTALALGIGANSTIFSVIQTVLIRPLPYKDADHLVTLFEKPPKGAAQRYFISPSDYFDWRDRSHTIESFGGYWRNDVNLTDTGRDAERVPSIGITWTLLPTLGIAPVLGRGMTREEGQRSGPNVTLITTELWERRYASDPSIIGKAIGINGQPSTVIGILPRGIHFASDSQLWNNSIRDFRGRPTPRYLEAVARLRPSIAVAQAQAEMDSIALSLGTEYPSTNAGWGIGVRTVPDDLVGNSRLALLVLLASVGLLLVIACANVANLLLAHASARQREVALRAALGASAGRLARQFLTESLLLGVTGGAAGLFLALAGVRAVRAFGPASVPRIHDVSLNLPVMFFTLAISVASGLFFGMAPVLRIRKPDLVSALKESGRSASGGSRDRIGRSALVIAQVTLAVLLVSSAGLLIKSFARLTSVNPGFRTDRILTANISLPNAVYAKPADVINTFDRIRSQAATLPGVQSVGTTTSLPLAQDLDYRLPFHFLTQPAPEHPEEQTAWHRMVSPGLLSALGTPLIAGRDFTEQDGPDAPAVVLINETLARQYWTNGSVIGQNLHAIFGGFGPLGRILVRDPKVIGIVTDIKYSGLGVNADPTIYFSSRQAPFYNQTLVLRTDASFAPEALISSLRQQLRSVDPNLPLARIRTMNEQFAESVAQPRFQAVLLAAFSGLALLLGSVGIYGVLSYSVVSRTREIGIRSALGGSPREILTLILCQGLSLVAAGLILGVLLSLATGRLIQNLLFHVKPADFTTYAAVCVLLAAIGLLAGYVPARNAAKIDPSSALRE